MALQPITLGADQLFTMGNGIYADLPGADQLAFADVVAMGDNTHYVLVYRVTNPNTPFNQDNYARAFTMNADGTQTWGNPILFHSGVSSPLGVAIDTTRVFTYYSNGTNLSARILSLDGLTLTAGPAVSFGFGVGFTLFVLGEAIAMSASTVLLGMWSRSGTRNAVRIQQIDVSGTTITVNLDKFVNLHEANDPFLDGGRPLARRINDQYIAWFWLAAGPVFWGGTKFDGTTLSVPMLSPELVHDGSLRDITDIASIEPGFILMAGFVFKPGPDQPFVQLLEITTPSMFMAEDAIVELTETAPAGVVTGGGLVVGAGRQAVVLWNRPGSPSQNRRFAVVNIGTEEIQEVGFVDFTLQTGLSSAIDHELVTMNPRRVMFTYTTGGGNNNFERVITVGIPLVPPLRWRQRDDCLTPGTATPCICFNLFPGSTVCIPPFWIRFTTTVQWGGRVGPLNRAY